MTKLNDLSAVRRLPFRWRSFSEPFWNATRTKSIILQYDPKSGRYQHFPRAAGIATGSRHLEWREVSGKGEIFSYTAVRRAREPFRGQEPFVIALVTLDEQVNIMANLTGCELPDVAIGLRVRPHWVPLDNGTHLLMFEPDR